MLRCWQVLSDMCHQCIYSVSCRELLISNGLYELHKLSVAFIIVLRFIDSEKDWTL